MVLGYTIKIFRVWILALKFKVYKLNFLNFRFRIWLFNFYNFKSSLWCAILLTLTLDQFLFTWHNCHNIKGPMGNLMIICSMMETSMKRGNKHLRFSHTSSKIMEFRVLDFKFYCCQMFLAMVNNVLWGWRLLQFSFL